MKIKKISLLALSISFLAVSVFALTANIARAAVTVPSITRDLSVGSTGDDVKALQQFLNASGYTIAQSGVGSSGKETTTFGYATKAALAKFQSANGVSCTGYLGSKTREVLSSLRAKQTSSSSSSSTTTTTTSSSNSTCSALTTENASLKSQISSLQGQISSLTSQISSLTSQVSTLKSELASTESDDSDTPSITAIKVTDGGNEGYVDDGDTIAITFSEAVKPTSINSSLSDGGSVSSVSYSSTGGVSVSSAGKVTIKNIATFDLGSVSESGTFTVKLALNSSGKVLTITLTSGDDITITDEDFSGATQISGTVKDTSGNAMVADSSIDDPTGTFGGTTDDSDTISITAIKVTNGGDDGYVDIGDSIAITFGDAIDPESINSDLEKGDTVTGVAYSKTGGVSVSSAGKVTIKNIATFDLGSVSESGTFTVKLALNSTGKILTITLTSGSDITITDEDFSSATQVGGTVEDSDSNEMETDSSISDPTGTFGGTTDDSDDDDDDGPYITSIKVTNNGSDGYIDTGDVITVAFSEAIDPESINSDLDNGGSVSNISYSETGGVSVVYSTGKLTIKNIATFIVGSVNDSGIFTSKLALSSTGKTLTITLTGGTDIGVNAEEFSDATQIGGTIANSSGDDMDSDSSIDDPTGTFSD
jgi:trimeric autotransporter adhesin